MRIDAKAAFAPTLAGVDGMTDEQNSIVELAECVKELCRVLEDVVPERYSRDAFKARLDAAYKKATRAKDRVNEL